VRRARAHSFDIKSRIIAVMPLTPPVRTGRP
jgi:hypothetical protein